jgi:hypothetical protein
VTDTSTTDVLPGFRYEITFIPRDGITRVNGVALETPTGNTVPLLRQVSHIALLGASGPFTKRAYLTITDATTWDTLWKTGMIPTLTNHGVKTQPELPPVDFTKEEVVLMTMGTTMNFAEISISEVRESADRLTAYVQFRGPQRDMLLQETQPCAFAVIPRSTKPVYFHESASGVTIVPVLSTISALDSLHTAPGTEVITDVASWKRFYDTQMPAGTALPAVNFGEHMVLLVCAGQGGGPVTIGPIMEASGKLYVDYSLSTKAVGETAPWTAVVVPKSEAPTIFAAVRFPWAIMANTVVM